MYVLLQVVIAMQYLTETMSVSCDDIINGRVQSHEQPIIPQFPKFIFSLPKCDPYDTIPTMIPVLKNDCLALL